MGRRSRSLPEPGSDSVPDGERPPEPPRVLVALSSSPGRDAVIRGLTDWPCQCVQTETAADARAALRAGSYDLALVGSLLTDGSGADLAREMASGDGGMAVIMLADDPTLEQAIEAMRNGVRDLINLRTPAHELLIRARSALDRSRQVRERDVRIKRLRKVCRSLNHARREVTRQVGTLCNDLVEAYHELSDQVSRMSVASEFNSLIRQELDIESLLRTALEFVLSKTGPTNAAVFLPSNSNDFSLGAYVNYDCPKDAADVLLEHLAGVVAPRMEHEKNILRLTTGAQLTAFLGDDAHWLGDSGAVTFACRHDNECLAVVILFRNRSNPFPESLLPTARTIADLFGKQLARVIHIHHRHLPKEEWNGFGEGEDPSDDIDLAA